MNMPRCTALLHCYQESGHGELHEAVAVGDSMHIWRDDSSASVLDIRERVTDLVKQWERYAPAGYYPEVSADSVRAVHLCAEQLRDVLASY